MANNNDNTFMGDARKLKRDEFYTRDVDVEQVLRQYSRNGTLKGKNISLPCHDIDSAFLKWFDNVDNFKESGVNSVIAIEYAPVSNPLADARIITLLNGSKIEDELENCNGDFESATVIDIMAKADLVITNPPFSKIRALIGILLSINTDFLIMGTNMLPTYVNVIPLIVHRKISLFNVGHLGKITFDTPFYDDKEVSLGTIVWATTLEPVNIRPLHLPRFNPFNYDYLDDCLDDVLMVDTINNIPSNYNGVMAIPISGLSRFGCSFNNDFVVLGLLRSLAQIRGCKERYHDKEPFHKLIIQRDSRCIVGDIGVDKRLSSTDEIELFSRMYYTMSDSDVYNVDSYPKSLENLERKVYK